MHRINCLASFDTRTFPTGRIPLTSEFLIVLVGVLGAAAPHVALAQTYTFSTLASFNSTNGASPQGNVTLDNSGNLYGTTEQGGPGGAGEVFELNAATDAVSVVGALSGAPGGSLPVGNVVFDSSGNIYGVTSNGGTKNDGTVFEINATTHAVTTLFSFTGTADGASPYSGLTIDSNGNLYGTTVSGGSSNDGVVYEIAQGSHAYSTVATFNGANGSNPHSDLTLDSSGNIYGTTSGGTNNFGTVFEIASGSHSLSTIATFTGGSDGINYGISPFGGLAIDSSGNLYGTTEVDFTNGGFGSVFKVAAGSHALSTLSYFNGYDGEEPLGDVAVDSNGNLFGTASSQFAFGGPRYDGTVWEIPAATGVLSALVDFTGVNGSSPEDGLTIDSSGDLFGTTSGGGADSDGTVFELKPLGTGAAAPEPCTLTLFLPGLSVVGSVAVRRRRGRTARS